MSNNSVLSSKYANIENLKVSNISGNLPFNDNINVKGRLFLNQTKEPEYDNEVVTKKYVDERVNTYTNDLDVTIVFTLKNSDRPITITTLLSRVR